MKAGWKIGLAACLLWFGSLHAYGEPDTVRTIEWEDLIPAGYDANDIIDEYDRKYNLSELPEESPLLKEMMAKVEETMRSAPIKDNMNGQRVKLPGYVVPLEAVGQRTTEFLLVPYFGACIHVPPPPPNQTVFVTLVDPAGAEIRQLYDVVWVTGVLKTQRFSVSLGDAGYTLEATLIEPYDG